MKNDPTSQPVEREQTIAEILAEGDALLASLKDVDYGCSDNSDCLYQSAAEIADELGL
jgi:hypothetical protein